MATTALDEVRARLRTWGDARLTLLRERGFLLTDIARDLNTDLSVVSRVNHGWRRSRPIENEIARRLGLPLSDAFPELYCDRDDGRVADVPSPAEQ